jgi:serine/threonine protein phosphatase PrpC
LKNSCLAAVKEANETIYTKAQNSKDFKKMGTTCVILIIKGDIASIAHVGDSRIYKIENNDIEQLTIDHTQVQEMLNRGILTPKEAEHHPSRSILARALGADSTVECDIKADIPLKAGQIFLLCTDGLANVNPGEIKEIVKSYDPENACNKLIRLANDRGGRDNVTVQIIKVKSHQNIYQQPETPPVKKKKSKLFLYFFLLIIILTAFLLRDRIAELFFHSENKNNIPAEVHRPELPSPIKPEKYSDLLLQADDLVKRGRHESALAIYKSILSDEPMHLGALNGINEIVTVYAARADLLKSKRSYKEALVYYNYVYELQPGFKKVVENIILCENQIKYGVLKTDQNGIDTTN